MFHMKERMKKIIKRTMIGEMSMPPRLGRMRRMGRRTGSVTLNRKLPMAFTNWLRKAAEFNQQQGGPVRSYRESPDDRAAATLALAHSLEGIEA